MKRFLECVSACLIGIAVSLLYAHGVPLFPAIVIVTLAAIGGLIEGMLP